jgi:hypothetical protein
MFVLDDYHDDIIKKVYPELEKIKDSRFYILANLYSNIGTYITFINDRDNYKNVIDLVTANIIKYCFCICHIYDIKIYKIYYNFDHNLKEHSIDKIFELSREMIKKDPKIDKIENILSIIILSIKEAYGYNEIMTILEKDAKDLKKDVEK